MATTIEPRYLLDTNIIIYVLEGRGEPLLRRFNQYDRGALVTSTLVFAEVMVGARRHKQERAAKAFFHQVVPQPFDLLAGTAYAELDFQRGNIDRLIAAHAVALDLTLVTANESDFADIPGLRIENWTR